MEALENLWQGSVFKKFWKKVFASLCKMLLPKISSMCTSATNDRSNFISFTDSVDSHSKLQQVLQIKNNESRIRKIWVNMSQSFSHCSSPVLSDRWRGRLTNAFRSCESNASIILCCRPCQLCMRWSVLYLKHAEPPSECLKLLFERKTHDTSQIRSILWNVDGYGYRNILHQIWPVLFQV